MPLLLETLAIIGTAAMIWVGGGIIVHGLEVFGLEAIPHMLHGAADWAGNKTPFAPVLAEWVTGAAGSAIIGLMIGSLIVALMHMVPKKEAQAQLG
jgi:predicted DNA repair protein MutK